MSLLDLIRPQWKHSNPSLRSTAVQNMDLGQQDIFATVATTDPVVEVRRIAVRKLTVLETLRNLLQDSDSEIRQIARAKVQEEYAKSLRNFEGTLDANTKSYIKELDGSSQLDDLIRNAKSASVRLELVGVSSKMATLAQVALRDPDEQVALAALKKVDREALVQDIADHSRHPAVRQAASDRVRPKATETPKKDDAILQQKRAAVMSHAQRLVERREIISVQDEFAQVLQEAKSLGMGNMQAEFDSMAKSFADRIQADQEKKWAEEKAAQAKAERLEKLQVVLTEMETLVADNASIGRESEVKGLQVKWNELGGESMSEVAPRFRAALSKFLRQIEQVQAARQDEQRQHELRKQIIDQMKGLVEKNDADAVDRQFKSLVREWESMPALDADHAEQKEFNALRETLNSHIHNRTEDRRRDFEERMTKLRGLIEKILNLDENQDFKEISKILRQTYLEWKDIVGEDKYQFQEIWKEYRAATARFEEMKEWESWRNEQERDHIIHSIDELQSVEDPAEALAKLRHLQQAWKDAGFVPQPKLQEYWDRYKVSTERINQKFHDYIEAQNVGRKQNLESKIAMCAQIEAISADPSENWKEKAKQVHLIQDEWKQVGPVPREDNQPVWDRFRKACDDFYSKHKVYLAKEDGDRQENLTKKESLCVKAESFRESNDWTGTTNRLRKLQDEWKSVGPVPKQDSEAIWARFREACDSFFERKRAFFEGLDAEKDENLKKKIALCERLEAMTLDPQDPAVVAEVDAIEAEWKAIGMVPKDQVDSVWARFCKFTDQFLEARAATNPALSSELQIRREAKQTMISRVKELCEEAGSNQAADAVRQLQEEWKQLGRSGASEQELFKSFREVCDEFFEIRRDQMEIQEQARKNNLQRKYLLIEQAERILESGNLHDGSLEEVKHLRRLWKEVGAVPREHSDKVWHRFNNACDAVFATVRGDKGPERSPQQ